MTVAIVNQKGGTGKTTTTLNLGSALAHYRKRVLLADLDPQASLTYCVGLHEVQPTINSLFYDNGTSMEDVMVEREGFYVLPSSIDLVSVEVNLVNQENKEYKLKEVFSQADDFDFVLIDCPPSLSILTINALTAADLVLIPILPEILSVRGLELIMDTIAEVKKDYNPDLEIAGVLPVMVDKRKSLNKVILDKIEHDYDLNVFQSHIQTSVKLAEAPMHLKSIINQQPNSKSTSDYLNLAKEIIVLNYK